MSKAFKTTRKPRPSIRTTKTRRCLMCARPFESTWIGERICRRCKSTDRWRAG